MVLNRTENDSHAHSACPRPARDRHRLRGVTDEAPDSADGVQVATAFYPLQYVAQRVAGDLATVENLTQPGAEPHDLELTVAETADLAEADLVVYQPAFQPAVDEAVGQNAGGEVLDVTDVVELRRLPSTRTSHAAGGRRSTPTRSTTTAT